MGNDFKKQINSDKYLIDTTKFDLKNKSNKSLLFQLISVTFILGCISFPGIYVMKKAVVFDYKDNQAARLSGIIAHFDEILTMSAMMAAATGESKWEARYNYYETQLNTSISEAKSLIPKEMSDSIITKTDKANTILINIEHEAFRLVRLGRLEDALKLLNDSEYQTQKEIYHLGIVEFSKTLKEYYHNAHLRYQLTSFVLIAVVMIGTFALSALYYYSIKKNKLMAELSYIARFPSENPNPVLRISESGNVLYSNEAGTELVKSWSKNLDNNIPNKHTSIVAEACKTQKEIEYEENIEKRILSISVIPVPNSNYANLYARDITDRKNAEKALEKSRNFLQTVIDAIPDSLTVIDMNHRICLANKTFQNLAKDKKPVNHNHYCYQVSHHNDKPCTGENDACPIPKVLKERDYVVTEHLHYNEAGEICNVEVTAAPVFDESGEITHIVEACRDITERKKAEQAIKQARNEAEEANKAKSTFLANMSHEIRTPMNSIIGFSNLLMETELDEIQKDHVHSVLLSGKHLLNLINDILDLSKIESGKVTIEITECPLIQILKPVESMLLPLAK